MRLPLLTVPLWLLSMKFFSALRLCASAGEYSFSLFLSRDRLKVEALTLGLAPDTSVLHEQLPFSR